MHARSKPRQNHVQKAKKSLIKTQPRYASSKSRSHKSHSHDVISTTTPTNIATAGHIMRLFKPSKNQHSNFSASIGPHPLEPIYSPMDLIHYAPNLAYAHDVTPNSTYSSKYNEISQQHRARDSMINHSNMQRNLQLFDAMSILASHTNTQYYTENEHLFNLSGVPMPDLLHFKNPQDQQANIQSSPPQPVRRRSKRSKHYQQPHALSQLPGDDSKQHDIVREVTQQHNLQLDLYTPQFLQTQQDLTDYLRCLNPDFIPADIVLSLQAEKRKLQEADAAGLTKKLKKLPSRYQTKDFFAKSSLYSSLPTVDPPSKVVILNSAESPQNTQQIYIDQEQSTSHLETIEATTVAPQESITLTQQENDNVTSTKVVKRATKAQIPKFVQNTEEKS